MRNTSTPNRWVRSAVRASAVAALTVTAATMTGAASAQAAAPAPTGTSAVPDGAVLVKEVRNDNGVLDVYQVTGPDAAGIRSSTGCAGAAFHVCLDISGSGLHVNYMANRTHFPTAGTVNMQINGPSGVITESGNFYTPADSDQIWTWRPNANVAAGYYCATSFTYTSRQGACNTVHA
ncbi:hypothetical protein R8Z50_21565 [Longispora sp. K20-0274]|uniref:hypothetical protein n=1 Tax=Longispora sp. K20-0274 TaxID=3088255 RepID=UPI00399B76F9